jgi:hypothetical protein
MSAEYPLLAGRRRSGSRNQAHPRTTSGSARKALMILRQFHAGMIELEQAALRIAVPLPAAVWLLGSGAGLLGWMRLKQTF